VYILINNLEELFKLEDYAKEKWIGLGHRTCNVEYPLIGIYCKYKNTIRFAETIRHIPEIVLAKEQISVDEFIGEHKKQNKITELKVVIYSETELKKLVSYLERTNNTYTISQTEGKDYFPLFGIYSVNEKDMDIFDVETCCSDFIKNCIKEGVSVDEFIEFVKENTIKHKDLVWCWDNNYEYIRALKFYNAENGATFTYDGRPSGHRYDNYEPYGEYETWPEWAKEAYKKLKD